MKRLTPSALVPGAARRQGSNPPPVFHRLRIREASVDRQKTKVFSRWKPGKGFTPQLKAKRSATMPSSLV